LFYRAQNPTLCAVRRTYSVGNSLNFSGDESKELNKLNSGK